jgi:hypothetical protein
MKALPTRRLGGGEPDSLAAGMITHTPTIGNGLPLRTVPPSHGSDGLGEGTGVFMPVDERSDSPNDMRGG